MRILFLAFFMVLSSNLVFSQTPPETFETRYCSGCHAIDKKMVGPAMKDVAARYQNRDDAVDYIIQKLKKGGVGVWGKIAMPANEAITDMEAKILAEWILNLK